jgi:hypothetical protein
MRNATVLRERMQIHSDRFETTIPKEHFFTRPPTSALPKKTQRPWLGYLITGVAVAVLVGSFQHQSPSLSPAGVTPAPVATPPPLPDPSPVPRAMPVAVATAPRAQLLHIRPIGVFENDRMPDGRVLGTTYRGELQSALQLPRTGAQPGDMWYTRADGHCWVLAPVYAGSQTMAWVDP